MIIKIIQSTFCILLLSLSFFSFSAKNISQLPVEAYAELPQISMMKLSPSGERVMYRLNKNGKDMLIIYDLKNKKILRGLDIEATDPNYGYFIDENRIILVATQNKRLLGYRGSHNISTAFIFNIKKNKIRQLLTPGKGITKGQSGLGDIVGLSPDKKHAYMPAFTDKKRKNSTPLFSLMKVNLNSSKAPKILDKGREDVIDYFVDDNGNLLARERYSNQRNIHRIEAYINEEWVEIFKEETPYITKSFSGLTPDKKHLVMVANNDNDRDAYFKMSLKDGAISDALISRDDADIAYPITNIQREIYGIKYSGFKPSYYFFNDKTHGAIKALQAKYPNNSVSIVSHSDDWQSIIIFLDGNGSSGDYFLYKENKLSFIASTRPQIPPENVHSIVETTYKARDGLSIPNLLTIPNNIEKIKEKLPLIMMPHGGPESYDRLEFDWLAQYFANKGYIVIQPQFRGSSGFGTSHTLKGRGEWGKKMQSDLTDGVNALINSGDVDKNRICIVGGSYGGYAALAGATFTPDLYQCVIAINGVSDIPLFLKQEKMDHGGDSSAVSYWEEAIAKNDLSDEFLESISPIKHVNKVKAPILLVHGEKDKIVKIEQSEDIYDELLDAKKEVTFVEIKDDNHHLKKYESRLKLLQEIDKFLEKHL